MTGGRFYDQFIQDYFAECDEHLATLRRALLMLEGIGPHRPRLTFLNELSRTLHTQKGLSGMVGLSAAERVAHAMEELLRAVEASGATMDERTIEALFEGTAILERCIAARKREIEPPPVDDFLAMLDALCASIAAPAPSERPRTAAALAQPGGETVPSGDPHPGTIYHFEFTSSPAAASRGVGVESIRARLRALGEILEARPRVVAGAGVTFDFWVAVPSGREPDPAWHGDNLTWTSAAPASDHPHHPAQEAVAEGEGIDGVSRAVHAMGSNVVRVELSRLDEVMRLVGELVVSRARLDQLLRAPRLPAAGELWEALLETNAAMERELRRLREGVMRIRLVPIGEMFERMRFAIRDIARESGKDVELELRGQQTEIDKLVVDRMLEPLLHLIRNAVSHGIESRDVRLGNGKPERGRIALRAGASGDRIIVEVEDDGAGIDVEAVIEAARRKGLLAPGQSGRPSELLDLLCEPGLSTREEADLVAGRGMGMAVVRSTIQALAGELTLETRPGEGTRFSIELPLTLMIVDALLVDIGGQQMAVPQPSLREILQVEPGSITRFESHEVVSYHGGILPITRLRRLFDVKGDHEDAGYLLVVGSETQPAGLLVDRVIGLREIVVQPVPDPLVAQPGIAGATELGDGRLVLILDAAALVRLAREGSSGPGGRAAAVRQCTFAL